jgi:hypothetical protein
MADINIIGVIVGAVVGMTVGALWYSVLFGKQWIALMKFSPEEMAAEAKGMGKTYTIAFIGQLVTAYILSFLMVRLAVGTVANALELGFVVWFGFILPLMVGTILWEGRSFKLFVINVLQSLVAILLAAVAIVLIG